MTRSVSFPCGICHKNISYNQKAILCNNCNFYVHLKCNGISASEYKELEKEPDDVSWFCKTCTTEMFPFGPLENDELLGLYNFDLPSFVDSAPSFEIISNLTNLPNLSDYDIDEHVPQNIDSRYFTLPELSSLQLSSSDFSILHTNIRSLSLHHDELVSLSTHTNLNLDVIGVSEMWHSKDNPISSNVDIPGYKFYETSSLSQNGGVGLYVKTTLTSNPRIELDSSTNDFETVWVEIENKKDKNILICCVYRHPCSNIDILTSHFQNLLSKISSNKLVFILGDFNINLLNYDSHTPTNDFVNNLFSHSLLPCIHHPTRISQNSGSVIDNIYTNAMNANITSGNILMQISDHFPQFLVLKNSQISHHKSVSFKHDYSKFKEDKFLEDFNQTDFTYIDNMDMDMNTKFDRFLGELNSLSHKHAPVKKRSRKESKLKEKPWINSKIQKMMRIRDKILLKLKKKPTDDNLNLYKKFRNRVSNVIKESKSRYFHNYFSSNSQNMKQLWSGIKSIISHKSSTSSSINKIQDKDGNVTIDSSKISNIFNDFFVNVADEITKTIPKTPKSPLDYLSNRTSNSLFLTPVTFIEVYDLIKVLNPSKSVGPNSIPIKLLKIIGPSVSPILALLVNQSFQTGIFPDKLKIAKVITLFKKGNPELPSNYRPISLLPIFSKIFEKLTHRRLYRFLEIHDVLFSLQFGFQENHSIDHALVSLTETVKNTLDNKRFGCGIFIDLQKAFDTVNHKILLSKLEHYGVRGCALEWFRSYLSDRKQYVSVNGSNSNLLSIACGVPQGSVLGPLLFLIYINDLPSSSKKLNFYLFADDTNIYCESSDLSNLIKIVNRELRSVKKWLDANKLSLNIDKTNYIIFHSSSSSVPSDAVVKIGKKHIKRVKFVKFLGLLLDEHLSWKYHLSELSKKLARTCGIFFRIRNLLPLDVLLCLYNALFLSFLQYGLIVWGGTYASYIEPIFKLQKKAVRAISFQSRLSPSLPIFKDLKLLKLSEIFELRLSTFVFDSVNKTSPSCFHNFFLFNSSVHQYSTRQASQGDLYLLRKNSSQYGLKSIRYLGAKLWNSLPVELRNAPSKVSFKTKMKFYLLSKANR